MDHVRYDGWVKDWEHTIFAVNLFCAFIKSVANLGMDLVSLFLKQVV